MAVLFKDFTAFLMCLLLLMLKCYSAEDFECECTCVPEHQCDNSTYKVGYSKEEFCNINRIRYCNRRSGCFPFRGCCVTFDSKIHCKRGPTVECNMTEGCSTTECTCEPQFDYFDSVYYQYPSYSGWSEYDNQENNSEHSKLSTGIGIGVGGLILFGTIWLIYFHVKDIKGRNKAVKNTKHKEATMDREADSQVYAVINENTSDNRLQAVGNPGYITNAEVISSPKQLNEDYTSLNKGDMSVSTSRYKSLKKPNEDLGNGEYMDPEKYTEPPNLPERNHKEVVEEEEKQEEEKQEGDDVDEDYVSQGTPDTITDENYKIFTMESENPSDNDVNVAMTKPHKNTYNRENSTKCVDVDEPDNNGNDYVDVDAK